MRFLALAGAVSLLSAGALLNVSVLAYFVKRTLHAYPRHSRPPKPDAQTTLAPAHR